MACSGTQITPSARVHIGAGRKKISQTATAITAPTAPTRAHPVAAQARIKEQVAESLGERQHHGADQREDREEDAEHEILAGDQHARSQT